MNDFRRPSDRLVRRCRRTAVAICTCAMILLARSARAEFPALPSSRPASGRMLAAEALPRFPGPLQRIGDVALQPGGVLKGRVVRTREGTRPEAAAGLKLALLRGSQTVAETATDVAGRFRLTNLSGGLVQIVVHVPEGPTWRFYRVWTPATQPPHAAPELTMRLDGHVVRGQSPFPITTFPQAATITAIAAGAIAAPVIYHNAKADNRVPASP